MAKRKVFKVKLGNNKSSTAKAAMSEISKFLNDYNENISSDYYLRNLELAAYMMANEMLKLTPRDTGELQRSQQAVLTKSNNKASISISYDDPKALMVHELPYDHIKDKYPNNPPDATHSFVTKVLQDPVLRKRFMDILKSEKISTKRRLKDGTKIIAPKGREYTG